MTARLGGGAAGGEPADDSKKHPFHPRCLGSNLSVREAERGQSSGSVCLVSTSIAGLLGRCAVVSQAIRLHNKPKLWPVEIDAEAIDYLLRFGLRELRRAQQREEPSLEVRVGHLENLATKEAEHPSGAVLAAHLVDCLE